MWWGTGVNLCEKTKARAIPIGGLWARLPEMNPFPAQWCGTATWTPLPRLPTRAMGLPWALSVQRKFLSLQKPLERKMRNQQENKRPGKEVSFSWCILHRVGITGNGAERAWSERFSLEWIKAAHFGQSQICQGCVGVEAGALGCHEQHSELHKVPETPCCCSTPKERCSGTSPRHSGPNGAVEEKSYGFSLLFSKHNIVFQK